MIEPITQSRWQEAQAAEMAVVEYDRENSRRAYDHIFRYLGTTLNQSGKCVAEVGCGAFPAVSFCENVDGWVFEPLWFASLEEMQSKVEIYWIKEPFEDANVRTIYFHEVWIFNCLQHVRDPELVITKAKEMARRSSASLSQWITQPAFIIPTRLLSQTSSAGLAIQ